MTEQQKEESFIDFFANVTCVDYYTGEVNVELTQSMRRFWGSVKEYADQHPSPPARRQMQNQIISEWDERELENAVARSLEERGISVRRQVLCNAGIADIVTSDAIYELKLVLDGDTLFQAIGQVCIYRQQINPTAKAYVVGYSSKKMTIKRRKSFVETARSLGVEIIFWKEYLEQRKE